MTKWINTILNLLKQIQTAQKERERGTGKTVHKPSPQTRRIAPDVRIEYSPDLGGDPDPAEVVWTWVPYQDDPNKGKDRPVVIIVGISDDLAGVQLTPKNKQRGEHIPVGSSAWDLKRRPSSAKVDRLLTIDPDDVRREGAVLDENRFNDVGGNVDKHHHIVRR